jgi:hypothetical protein
MTMPGFTAETSTYRSTKSYRAGDSLPSPVGGVIPQLRIGGGGLGASCGSCNCDPGQCCEEGTFGGCECRSCGGGGVVGGRGQVASRT